MTAVLIPFAGLALVGPAIWAVTAVMDRHHHRNDNHQHELKAIDRWLHAIKEPPMTTNLDDFEADLAELNALADAILRHPSARHLQPMRKTVSPPNGWPMGKWPRDTTGPAINRWRRETAQDCGLGQ